MDSMIRDALAALLADRCTPQVVRAIESGESSSDLWLALRDAGFADALISEDQGGAGLDAAAVAECWMLLGQYAMPLPLAETMVARSLLASAAITAPETPVALGSAVRTPAGSIRCASVSGARTAGAVLANLNGETRLLSVAQAQSQPAAFELDLTLEWSEAHWRTAQPLPEPLDTRLAQALVLSLQLAGTLDIVFKRTLSWANERVQFGKPIGKFQAIQHQLSLMAEESFAASMAARIACLTNLEHPRAPAAAALPGVLSVLDPLRIAIAKARTSEAALQVAQMAHAIHGAIGFTHEFDLQLLTRRLHAWRQAAGSESAWHDAVGRALVAQPASGAIDLLRNATDVVAPAA
jgi:acyl-CoA dehydrogenase